MKKVIEGYIARDYNNIIFSNKPMKQNGFFGDGNIWYPTIEHEEHFPLDFRADIHEYMNIPELTEENSPRHCTITIEVGDFVGEKLNPEYIQKKERIRHSIEVLAEETGCSCEDAKAILSKYIPDISKYLSD